MNRRTLVTLAASAAAGLTLTGCTAGADAPTTPAATGDATEPTALAIALPGGDADPRLAAVESWAQAVTDATDGRFTVTVDGGATADADTVAAGTVALAFVDGEDLAERNGDFGVFNLPYVFDSADAQASVLANSDVTGDLYGSLAGEGLTVLGGSYGGARNLLSTQHPVTTPADVAGQHVAVEQSPMAVRVVEAFGAVAVPLGRDQVAPGLSGGSIQGAEGTLTDFAELGVGAGAFVSLTHHQLVPAYLVAHSTALDAMSRADREAVAATVPGFISDANAAVAAAEDAARTATEGAGATYTEVEPLAFEATVDPIVSATLTTPARQALYDAASSR